MAETGTIPKQLRRSVAQVIVDSFRKVGKEEHSNDSSKVVRSVTDPFIDLQAGRDDGFAAKGKNSVAQRELFSSLLGF